MTPNLKPVDPITSAGFIESVLSAHEAKRRAAEREEAERLKDAEQSDPQEEA